MVGQTFKHFGWMMTTMVGQKVKRRKVKTGVTLDPELYKWIQEKIKTKKFSNLTHAVERGLYELKERMDAEEEK